MPSSLPLGVICTRHALTRALSPTARHLLTSGQVLGFSRKLALDGDGESHWDSGTSVCVPCPQQDARWAWGWPDLRALGIGGLGDALVSLHQPPFAPAPTIARLWQAYCARHALPLASPALLITAYGCWLGVDEPGQALRESWEALRQAVQDGPLGLAAFDATQWPSAAIGAYLLEAPKQSAHGRVRHAAEIARAVPLLVRTLASSTQGSGWVARAPWSAPTGPMLRAALDQPLL